VHGYFAAMVQQAAGEADPSDLPAGIRD